MSKSVLRVTGANYTDSGNYTCFREDAPELSSSQYVFIYGIMGFSFLLSSKCMNTLI